MDDKVIDISEFIKDEESNRAEEILPETIPKDPNYWRSFRELYSDPAFLREKKNEFKPGVSETPDENSFSKFSRRKR